MLGHIRLSFIRRCMILSWQFSSRLPPSRPDIEPDTSTVVFYTRAVTEFKADTVSKLKSLITEEVVLLISSVSPTTQSLTQIHSLILRNAVELFGIWRRYPLRSLRSSPLLHNKTITPQNSNPPLSTHHLITWPTSQHLSTLLPSHSALLESKIISQLRHATNLLTPHKQLDRA